MGIINKPNDFTANTTASASEVNDNFDTIYNEFNGSIAAANLATGAVTTAKIADSNVTTAKIADDNVTAAKLADDSVFPANLTSGLSGSTWAWQSWTPTFTNLSGGTITTAKYAQIGKTVFYVLKYTLAGAGVAGSVTFTLPVTANANFDVAQVIGTTRFEDTGTGVSFGVVDVASSTTGRMLVYSTGGTYLTPTALSSTIPHIWANTDIIRIVGSYEAA